MTGERARKPASTPPPDLRWLRRRRAAGLALGAITLLAVLAMLSVVRGALGAAIAHFLRGLFGWGTWPAVIISLAASVWMAGGERLSPRVRISLSQVLGAELLLFGCLGLLHLPLPTHEGYLSAARGSAGGYVGWSLVRFLTPLFGRALTGLLLAAMAIGGAALAFEITKELVHSAIAQLRGLGMPLAPPSPARKPESPAADAQPQPSSPRPRPSETIQSAVQRRAPRRLARSARLPSLDLLAPASPLPDAEAEIRFQSQVLEETLAQFGVPARVVEVRRGPTVTQFGVEPGFMERKMAGGAAIRRKVRVSRIAALANDLALALAVPAVRIEAPVPGRPLVGIEVPNRQSTLVNLRSVIESEAYQKIRSPLRVALGQDVSGQPVAADLAVMPHLLIAGATGTGKSVCLHSLIACLLLENTPDALNLILIDPKRVEMTPFSGIPHLIGPVIVEVPQVVAALRWLCQEMDRRYNLFAAHRVRHIEGLNALAGRHKAERLPYVVVCIDELADLMLAAPDDVERSICRLAQMGRATGIHLVVATQRPSVDVVTGLIKANFPARIAFAVSSQVDSRVILDAAGAEQLLGRGDMLYMAPDAGHLLRLQGCFASDAELAAIAEHWRQSVEADETAEPEPAPWEGMTGEADDGDDLLEQALALAREQGQLSASLLQRRLRIGYPRAARLIAELEARGIVGPEPGGGRPREVLPPARSDVPDEEEA